MKRFLIRLILCLFILGVIVGGGYSGFKYFNQVSPGEIEIFEGASTRQITDILENYKLIKNSEVLYYYIRLKTLYYEKVKHEKFELTFHHGTYEIKQGTFNTLIQSLNEPPVYNGPALVLTFPEGTTIEKMSATIVQNKIATKDEFYAYIQNEKVYQRYQKLYTWLPDYDKRKKFVLEGFLQPNTYHYEEKPTVEKVVDMMLEETDLWYKQNFDQLNNLKLNFNEIVTLASIVEAESKFKEDRPKIAQVFYNRLNSKMKLGSDMTAAYANGQHKVFMYNKDVSIDSPYNTYKVPGLPIGPINSPSKDSLLAVIQPSGPTFKALYFYARPNGQTFYANTWKEHETNRKKWEAEWKALEKKQ